MTKTEFYEYLATERVSRLRVIYECEQTFRKLQLIATKIHLTAPNGSELEADASALQSHIGAHRILLEMERSHIATVTGVPIENAGPVAALH